MSNLFPDETDIKVEHDNFEDADLDEFNMNFDFDVDFQESNRKMDLSFQDTDYFTDSFSEFLNGPEFHEPILHSMEIKSLYQQSYEVSSYLFGHAFVDLYVDTRLHPVQNTPKFNLEFFDFVKSEIRKAKLQNNHKQKLTKSKHSKTQVGFPRRDIIALNLIPVDQSSAPRQLRVLGNDTLHSFKALSGRNVFSSELDTMKKKRNNCQNLCRGLRSLAESQSYAALFCLLFIRDQQIIKQVKDIIFQSVASNSYFQNQLAAFLGSTNNKYTGTIFF